VQSAGSVIVSAVSIVAYFFLNKYVKDANARTVLLGAIENGVKWGVAKTAGALPGHALSVNIGSQAAAAALQHVIDTVPDALARHGNDFAGIVRIALGKLPIDGSIDDATVNQIVANATGKAPTAADIGKQLIDAMPAAGRSPRDHQDPAQTRQAARARRAARLTPVLTGTAGAAILAIAAKLLPAIIAAIAAAIASRQGQVQERVDAQALGTANTTATVNRETADAQRRAADATLNAPDTGNMLDAMSRGEF
jgi:hypothetical protein